MPHVLVKMHAGRSHEDKVRLADEIAKALKTAIGSSDKSISVSIEDVEPAKWGSDVYKPDIAGKPDTLIRAPGYDAPV